ncbi:MAG: hypothetical protein V3V00_00890 [Saprospiraceae bacterium]
MNLKMKLKSLFFLYAMCFVFIQFISGQEKQNFLFTKGDNNISVITMGSTRSAHCTVVEYPEFLVIHEIPKIPTVKNVRDSIKTDDDKANPLMTFIDSIYLHKPIKYILNSHHHSHSLSIIIPFLDKGTKLVTTKENIKIYNKKGLFGNKTSEGFSNSIILISSDTMLLAKSKCPIEVLYLKKSDYKSIPTETYLFFNFPKQKLLATSCMVYLKDKDTKYGYKGIVYNDRLINVKEIIVDKNLDIDYTLQLYKFRFKNGIRKLPIFPISYHQNVLKYSWHRLELSEHFQNMSYEELTTKKDSLLNFLIETDIYHIVLNHAVYKLIEKKEYQKAVAIAKILVQYEPGRLNEIDTLGEAYYNNGQLIMAIHYNSILKESKQSSEGLGLAEWKKNQKNRLVNNK